MNRFLLKLNDNNYCISTTILQEVYEPWIEITYNLYLQAKRGRKFDIENMQWLDVWDEMLVIPKPPEPISEQEKILMETAINVEYLTCIAELDISNK